MITSTRECVAHNDLSVMILQNTAKIWHILSCLLYSTYSSILILSILGTNDHWHERVCRVYWPLTLTHIFQPFRYEFAIKLLKYGTSCRVRSTACTVLDGCFPSLAQMITSMRGCVVWPWSLSSRSFIHDFVIKLLKYGTSCCFRFTAHKVLDEFSHIWHKWSPAWEGVSHTMTFDLDLFLQGYLAVTLSILWIIFICGTNTAHEGTMCYVPFPGQ